MKRKSMLYLPITLILCICVLGNMFMINRTALATTSTQSGVNNIDVNLVSNSNVMVKENEASTIKYNITPNEFKTSIESAVFLVDVSSQMKNPDNGGTRDRIKFAEDIIRNTKELVNKSNNTIKLTAGVMGYSDNIYTFWSNNFPDKENTDLSKICLYNMNTDNGYRLNDRGATIANTIMGLNSSSRNITPALEKADGLLQGDDKDIIKNRNKAIIIITSGTNNINWADNKIINIINKGYKIITIDISNQTTTQENTIDENNLKDMTKKLAKNGTYANLTLKSDGNNTLSDEQKKQLSISDSIYLKVLPVDMNSNNGYNYSQNKIYIPAMTAAIYGTINASNDAYKVGNAKFTFDTGGNFKIGDKAIIEYDGKQEEVPIKDIGNNQVEIDISQFIVYKKGDQGFIPTIKNFNVSFNVIPIGTVGTFGKDIDGKDISNLSYTKIIGGQPETNKILLETPIITVEERDKPKINIKLNDLKVNGVSTKNYYNIWPQDEVEFTYKVTAEDLLISDINKTENKEIVLVLDTSGSMNYGFKDDTPPSTGENSRIKSLKDSAKSFINRFNNYSNVKIGMVPYSYYSGYINNIKPFTTINDINKSDFKNYIDNIKVEGATNQGDGLRTAGDMLINGDHDAKKYLIFLTDGEATAITIKDPEIKSDSSLYRWATNVYTFYNGNLQTDTMYKGQYIQNNSSNDVMRFLGNYNNNNQFAVSVNGSYTKDFPVSTINDFNDNQKNKYIDFNSNIINDKKIEIGTDYAMKIGTRLMEELPELKVRTIGCALKTENVNLAKKVNNSMKGTYYSASDGNSTEKIFDDLADSILSEYEIKNVNFNLNIPDNFEISPNETSFKETNTGYVKSLENIKYKLNADKTKYVAEPFYITFKLKAKSIGSINFGTNCEVTYNSVKNNQMKKTLPITQLKIVDSIFPPINVELQTPIQVPYSGAGNIDIKYKVEPQEFSYEDIYGKLLPKDVFVLIDSSSANKVNIGNNIFNKIANDEILKLAKTRYSIITYGNNTTDGIRYVNESMEQREIKNESVYSKYIEDVFSSASNSSSQGSTCKILPALKKVEDIDNNGRSDKNLTNDIDNNRQNGGKFIIIVGERNITDINELSGEAKILSDKGYKIITLNLGDIIIKDKWKNQDGYKDSEEGEIEPNNNLKEIHYKLSDDIIRSNENLQDRIDDNYFIKMDYDKFNDYKKNITQMNQFFNQQDNFSFNLLNNQISPKIAVALRGSFEENLSVINPQFEFNLQGKCNIIGIPKYDDQNNVSNFKYSENDEDMVTFNIPTISYKLNYITGMYELKSMTTQPIVSFTIKPKDNIKDTFTFSGGQAYFNYKEVIYGRDKKLPLDTPVIMFNTSLPELF